MASRRSPLVTKPNSSTPDSTMKHLKPMTPASSRGRSSLALPGTAPPQKPTSTQSCPAAAASFSWKWGTVVVGGMLLSGMSTRVVTPPAAAARVALRKPSHSVRPGSLMCTCESTMPGMTTRSPASTTGQPGGTSSYAVTLAMTPLPTWTERGDIAPAETTRRPRSTKSREGAIMPGILAFATPGAQCAPLLQGVRWSHLLTMARPQTFSGLRHFCPVGHCAGSSLLLSQGLEQKFG
jgi:hypothetical protein